MLPCLRMRLSRGLCDVRCDLAPFLPSDGVLCMLYCNATKTYNHSCPTKNRICHEISMAQQTKGSASICKQLNSAFSSPSSPRRPTRRRIHPAMSPAGTFGSLFGMGRETWNALLESFPGATAILPHASRSGILNERSVVRALPTHSVPPCRPVFYVTLGGFCRLLGLLPSHDSPCLRVSPAPFRSLFNCVLCRGAVLHTRAACGSAPALHLGRFFFLLITLSRVRER